MKCCVQSELIPQASMHLGMSIFVTSSIEESDLTGGYVPNSGKQRIVASGLTCSTSRTRAKTVQLHTLCAWKAKVR